MDEIVTAISTVGFPIVCTLILMYLLVKENDQHKEEMSALKETIHNNTVVLAEIKQLLNDIMQERSGGSYEIRN